MDSAHAKLSVEQLLRNAKLRCTPVRVALLKLLEESTQPLTAPEMLARLPSATDTVTVYRTLNTFPELLLIHRIRAKDRSWSYALGAAQARQAHRHPHFVCDEC